MKNSLFKDIQKHPEYIHVILGPRQVGKTTFVQNELNKISEKKYLYVSADEVLHADHEWIELQWQTALDKGLNTLLVIDEVQKIPDWSSSVKKLWDAQKVKQKSQLRLIVLGSSSLHIQQGLTESLAGRFVLHRAFHWNLAETNEIYKMTLPEYMKFGGYPGSYPFIENEREWRQYIQSSIVDTVIGKDILQLAKVNKPALFRQTFSLLSSYPAQEISYNKLLGQLQDKGNIDMVKYYIELYEGAYLFKAIHKFSTNHLMKKGSSPKIIPLCPALIDFEIKNDKDEQGRIFESIIGADLLRAGFDIFYWRDGNSEVDYVLRHKGKIIAIEVKSGRKKSAKGLETFKAKFKNVQAVFITLENYPDFSKDVEKFIERVL